MGFKRPWVRVSSLRPSEILLCSVSFLIKAYDDLKVYGLDPANVVVNIETTKGEYEILIGDYNQIEKTYYIKVSNLDSVYLIEPESKLNYAFNYDTDAFIEGQKK